MIASHWPGNHWSHASMEAYARAIEPMDARLVMPAVVRAVNELEFYPKVAVLREFVQIERRLAEPEPPAGRMVEHDINVRLDPWVTAWCVARYKHGDMGVLPQQKPGYDTLQRENPHYKTYVWPSQQHMEAETAAAYQAEGAGMTAADVFRLLG
jgi:hypothetical protein